MIELKHIVKDYKMGDNTVHALKDVSISFRQNEFVAILGPSGGGKTTMLNIIGGLDRYDSGDLIVSGKSTAKYKDWEWDSYRNHAVGFVFQSYNLIPHQTVLANVELALTISGISGSERKERARKALEDVGLGDQCDKKPNQLSGGQMQRVAIARALVNNPEIVLADEPTGALDSQSSAQIMDILNEVAKDRLVVMVTHNPELAEQYATRIVRIKDGQIVGDTAPFVEQEEKNTFNPGRASMSIFTALSLSLNNLLTKKGRTFLTAFAGSIGIIGIALILALSTGVNNYIDDVQRDSLSSYPLTIQSNTSDLTSRMASLAEAINIGNVHEGTIVESKIVSSMFESFGRNNLKDFKNYIESNRKEINPLVTTIMYNYGTTLQIYKEDTTNGIVQLNPSAIFSSFSGSSAMMAGVSYGSTFTEMIDNDELLQKQYEVVAGKWPEKYDECMLILNNKNSIVDYMVYSLGIRDPKELSDAFLSAYKGEITKLDGTQLSFDYDYFLNLKFKVICPADKYRYNKEYDIWEDMSDDKEFMSNVLANGVTLKIVGIVIPAEGSSSMTQGIGYRSSLTEYLIKTASEKEIIKQQLSNKDVDVFSRKTFEQLNSDDNKSGLDFSNMIKVDEKKIASAFGTKIDQNQMSQMISDYVNNALGSISVDTTEATLDVTGTFVSMANGMFNNYIEKYGVSGMASYNQADIQGMVNDYLGSETCDDLLKPMVEKYGLSKEILKSLFSNLLDGVANTYLQLCLGNGLPAATLTTATVEVLVNGMVNNEMMINALSTIGSQLAEIKMKAAVGKEMANMSTSLIQTIASGFKVDASKLASAFEFGMDEEELTRLMSTYMSGNSKLTAEDNLLSLGYADMDDPSSISFYFTDFNNKDVFKSMITAYNDSMKASGNDESVISYTDITGILMSSITTIINAISYVLIAFVSISLIVSSIMIGIITYISVLERTKEIGILRAMGASKKNVSSVFSAETFIIGLISGLIGIGTTIILCLPINMIIHKLTNINNINASLPVVAGIILIGISVILTLIGGLLPSKMAAKCDPVVALRSE